MEDKIFLTEQENDNAVPAEIKEKLNESVKGTLHRISLFDKKIREAIDDVIDENSGEVFTVTEINAALLNILSDFNRKEITQTIV